MDDNINKDNLEIKQGKFVGYEYKEIMEDSSKASFLIDGYRNFGWEVDKNLSENAVENNHFPYQKKVVMRLKRNRKIINKVELTRLQRNFEACINEINELEKSKTSLATVYALIIGIIGTAFMAGSVFAVASQVPNILLCIVFAIPAIIGWTLPYFIYKKTIKRKIEKVTPIIEQKYDEIYEICEKGSKLLH